MDKDIPTFDKGISVREVCESAEETCGYNTVEGAQKIGQLWRIYTKSEEARMSLAVNGLIVKGAQVGVKQQNPFLINRNTGEEKQTTKLIIGDVPLSFSDEEILKSLDNMGCKIVSKLFFERDRDERGQLTRFKTGRRFIFIERPEKCLPKKVKIGFFQASLYHKEMKTEQRRQTATCGKCLQVGHYSRECENEIVCKVCREEGHKQGDPICSLTASGVGEAHDMMTGISPTPSELVQPYTSQKGTKDPIPKTTVRNAVQNTNMTEDSGQHKRSLSPSSEDEMNPKKLEVEVAEQEQESPT